MDKNYVRTSIVSEYIDGLIEEKRALGFSYQFEEYLLNVFDNYCNENGLKDPCFSRQFLGKWLNAWDDESPSYHCQRISFVRQLSLYMNSLGIHSYIPVERVKKGITIPHFLSCDELQSFFSALDENPPITKNLYAWRMWNTYRVIFRLIYSCGLRNSEACSLHSEDVDLRQGSLTIYHSKGDKDRVVCVSRDMNELLISYKQYILNNLGYTPVWFFPSRFPQKHVHKTTLDHHFNRAWALTPYADACGKKPTVHCLRHSFVVDRMNAWINEGLSYDLMLPYLSKYLEHSCIEESLYYYHLNEEANIFIRKRDRTAGRVIPEVEKYGP